MCETFSIFDNKRVRFTIAETGEVIPSEIGVVRMSIQDGVVSRYNQMIGPGTLPVGYKSDAKVVSMQWVYLPLKKNTLEIDRKIEIRRL